jgi:hypothetical protein
VKAHGIALALDHGALEVVVEDDARRGPEEAECLDVATKEARHRRSHREVHESKAAEREHHHEREEVALSTADGDLAEVGPVDLSLLAGQHRATQVRLGLTPRTQTAHDRAKTALRAAIAASDDHGIEPARPKARVLGERVLDERQERVDESRADDLLGDRQPAVCEHALDGVVMTTELARDRADGPSLDVVQAEDRSALVVGDRLLRGAHATSWRAGTTAAQIATTRWMMLAGAYAARQDAAAARAANDGDGTRIR